jgi:PAS domain S-box-containing protein
MLEPSGFMYVVMIVAVMIAVVYIYFFTKTQEKFVAYWSLSWLFYTVGLILLILSAHLDGWPMLEARKLFDLFNILYLLSGAYAFMHVPTPTYWRRFSLYLILWVIVSVFYKFDVTITYLPVSIYQVILTIALCVAIVRHWDLEPQERNLSIIIFLFWGLSKAAFSYFETDMNVHVTVYLVEVLMSNTLNFCILLIYLAKMKKEFFVKDKIFRVMADNANDIIFYYQVKPYPNFVYMSPSIEKLTGYTAEEFQSHPKLYIEISHVDDLAKSESLFDSTHYTPGKQSSHAKIIRWTTKDGTTVWMEFHNSPIYEGDKLIAVDGVIRDITKRKQSEESLKQSKKATESFLSYISHELKTPMTSILGYISAIRDGTMDDEQKKLDAIDLIYEKALTLKRSTDDLYQLSQLETKQFDFKFMQLAVSDFLNKLIYKYSWDVTNAGLKLEFDQDEIDRMKYDVIADPERIETVFLNILFNAIKFTEPGGTIRISCELAEKSKIVVSITDTGVGIPEDELEKTFRKFYRSSSYQPLNGPKGNGLGLAISKEVILAHGGQIWAKSSPGKGSVFSFSLPIYIEQEQEVIHNG